MAREQIVRCGGDALRSYEEIWRRKPDVDHQMLTKALSKIVMLRDAFVEQRRGEGLTPEDEERLRDTNAIISFAFSAGFPLAGVQWERIEKTMRALQKLVRSGNADASMKPSD